MPAAPDRQAFTQAISQFATGVTVVTSVGENGPSGLTANAVCSLSVEPLLVLACLDRGSRTLRAIESSGRLAINVLARDQEALARCFAAKGPEHEKFTGVAWTDRDGLPRLDGAVAWLAGEVRELVEGGDHRIAVTEVTGIDAPGGEPLLYHRGRFRSF